MQPVLTASGLVPNSIVDAQVLQVPAATHRALVQATAPANRGPGQQVFAAIDPVDLTRALAGIPSILSNDARQARILRGT